MRLIKLCVQLGSLILADAPTSFTASTIFIKLSFVFLYNSFLLSIHFRIRHDNLENMTSLTNQLIRRGVEGLQTSFRDGGDGSKLQSRFSALSATVVIVTVLLIAFGQFAVGT